MKKSTKSKLLLKRETLKDLGPRLAEAIGADSIPIALPTTTQPTNFYTCAAPPPPLSLPPTSNCLVPTPTNSCHYQIASVAVKP